MSLPTSSNGFAPGSHTSVSSVRDVIASYRRAQYLVAGASVASVSDGTLSHDEDDDDEDDLENGDIEEEEEDDAETPGGLNIQDRIRRASHGEHEEFVAQLEWDHPSEGIEGAGEGGGRPGRHYYHPEPSTPFLPSRTSYAPSPRHAQAQDENTPLLHPSKQVSFGRTPRPHARHSFLAPPSSHLSPPLHGDESSYFPDPEARRPVIRPVYRRESTSSIKAAKVGGQSTFGQTLFNSIAILIGIGILSEPLAFAYAGWGLGTVLIVFYGVLSCYTAKILARIILSDHRLRSYADIGRMAFGNWSTLFISVLFCLELFAVSVVLVTLYADSLHSVIPTYSANTYKLWGLLILVPTVFLPLSLLSYTSVLGILSTVLLIAVVIIDGLSKKEAPGSLWDPAPTSLGIDNWRNLGVAFGLFMAGFSGHAVIPSLARDMVDPSQFDRMIDWAFLVATFIYALIGYVGYLMFGNDVSPEISLDLLRTKGYSSALNQAALWMLVLSPLSKFALTTQPLNYTLSILLHIDRPAPSPELTASKMTSSPLLSLSFKKNLIVLQRVGVTVAAVGVSILIPEFSQLMAFLGSFSAFLICIIGPVCAKVSMERRCGVVDGVILVLAVGMAVWGTVAAFLGEK